MTLVLRYAARSDVGRVRAKNDDSAYVGRHLAVLADGMGGHVGGDVASASTVLDLAPLDAVGYEDPATVLPDEIQNANLILNELVHANPKLAGMGTTCTAGAGRARARSGSARRTASTVGAPGLGRAAHDSSCPAHNRTDDAALKHQTAAQNDDALRDGEKTISTTHEGSFRELEEWPITMNGG